MWVNNEQYNHHFVRVGFDNPGIGQNQFFTGTVDRVVFGAAQYQWHPDPVPAAAVQQGAAVGSSGEHGRFRFSGHADPDGPGAMSTVTAAGPESLYDLPNASIVVLRGRIASN
jgi:hypothetical protein